MGSRVPALPEIALGACLVGLAVFTAIGAEADNLAGEREPAAWWEWLIVVAPAAPVAFRRVAPLSATTVTVAAQIAVWGIGLATLFFAPLIMIYTVCAEEGERGRRLGACSGIALCAMTLLGVFVAPDVTLDLLVFTGLASAMAYLLGTRAAQSRAVAVALAEELAVAQVERDVARERAAANERQRIARELHDIVGHSLSVIAVRAEAADRVAPKNPAAAVDAVAAIATTARSSLADVRRVLAGLREESVELELAPLPSLDSIPALIASFSEAGLAVTFQDDTSPATEVSAAIGASAYRIVQEALTNVLKHGGPSATAIVHLSIAPNQLDIRIDDTGRGVATAASTNDGLGLTGMAERAEVLGGSLDFGPRPGGGYRVSAGLPLQLDNRMGAAQNGSEIDG